MVLFTDREEILLMLKSKKSEFNNSILASVHTSKEEIFNLAKSNTTVTIIMKKKYMETLLAEYLRLVRVEDEQKNKDQDTKLTIKPGDSIIYVQVNFKYPEDLEFSFYRTIDEDAIKFMIVEEDSVVVEENKTEKFENIDTSSKDNKEPSIKKSKHNK